MAMAHILVIPFPAQGHVNPLMLLSRKIVKHGFKITFVNTDFNHNRVVGALDSLMDSNISLVSIPDGLGPEDDRNELGKLCEAMLRTMPEKLEELINYINASNGDDKISCIVADAAGMGWAIEVGIKMGIKRAFFWPGTAASLALQFSIPRLLDDGIINSDARDHPPVSLEQFSFLEKFFNKTKLEERTWAKLVNLNTLHWYCDGLEPTRAALRYEAQVRAQMDATKRRAVIMQHAPKRKRLKVNLRRLARPIHLQKESSQRNKVAYLRNPKLF